MDSVASVSAIVWLRTISRSWERLTVRGVVALKSPSARRQLGAVALSTIYPGSLSSAAFEAFFPFSEPPEALSEAFFCSEEETLSCVPERALTVMVRLPSGAASTAMAMTNRQLSISCPPVHPLSVRQRSSSDMSRLMRLDKAVSHPS